MRTIRLSSMFVLLALLICDAVLAMEETYVIYCDPNAVFPNGIPVYTNSQNRAWVARYLKCGQQVKVLGAEADVLKIENDAGVAYIESRYVRRLEPVSGQVMEPVHQAATPTVTPQVAAGVLNPRSEPGTPAPSPQGNPYISRGMNEIFLSGLVVVPHFNTSATVASVHVGYGRYLTDWFAIGPLFSAQFAGSDAHSITAAGVAQFVPRLSERFYLVAGAGVGVNNVGAGGESDTDLAAVAYFGPRVFVARHVALDVQYSLGYRRVEGLGFKDTSVSSLVVGFAFIF